jgi:4-amino-4-deoxy-L-arabinose transferase-like glycosyltransferase
MGINRAALVVILLLAAAIRLGWGLSRPVSDDALSALPDQVEYLTLGRNVLHAVGMSFVDPRFGDRVYAFRMPGYPLFVAACGGNVRVVRIAQAILDVLTVLAVFLLARLLMPGPSRRAPLLAALIVALNPLLVYFSALVLSETLFVAMLMWGMVLLVVGIGSSDRRGRVLVWLPGAILLSLSVLVRPSAGLLPVVLGIGAMFVNHRARAAYESTPPVNALGRWPLPIGATMLLLVGLALLPWALRNYRIFHRLVWTDSNSGFTLYDGYNPDATGASDQRFVRNVPQLRLMDELGRSQYLTIQATAYLRAHPRRVADLALVKAARTWSPMPLSDSFGSDRNRAILLLYSIPFDLLVLAGLWLGDVRRSVKAFVLLPAIYFTLIHALTVGSLRYRLPAEPALAILAACLLYRPMSGGERVDN